MRLEGSIPGNGWMMSSSADPSARRSPTTSCFPHWHLIWSTYLCQPCSSRPRPGSGQRNYTFHSKLNITTHNSPHFKMHRQANGHHIYLAVLVVSYSTALWLRKVTESYKKFWHPSERVTFLKKIMKPVHSVSAITSLQSSQIMFWCTSVALQIQYISGAFNKIKLHIGCISWFVLWHQWGERGKKKQEREMEIYSTVVNGMATDYNDSWE